MKDRLDKSGPQNPLGVWWRRLRGRLPTRGPGQEDLPFDGDAGEQASISPSEALGLKAAVLIQQVLQVQQALLLTEVERQERQVVLRVTPALEGTNNFPTRVSWSPALMASLGESSVPLTSDALERLADPQASTPQDQETLGRLKMQVYVPLPSDEGAISILALGPQAGGERYSRRDLDLLALLVEQTRLALRNDQLFARLEDLNLRIAPLHGELQQLEAAKSSFLTIASHELKTPLTLIQGYANMLSALPPTELSSPEKVGYVTEGINRGTSRLRQIIEDMLDLSRIDSGNLHLQRRECAAAHLVDMVLQQTAPSAAERQQKISVSGLDALPPLEGDAQRLYQAFYNVVENAIKYTPDGGQITISGRAVEQEGARWIEIVIADSGIGIAPEHLPRILDAFYHVGDPTLHSSSKVQFKGGGPGLGLAISRGIIQAHGGRLWAESAGYDEESCPGSQIYIQLPVSSSGT